MPESEIIRVMLVDDHAVVRSGLSAFMLVYDDLELVAEARNGREAVMLVESAKPDVVLMDLVMPEMDGAQATRAIRQRCPAVQVVALTSFKDDDLVQAALEAGAIGYLLKNISADELAAAIRKAHQGRATLAPEAAQVLVQATRASHKLGHDLTAREREVLALLAQGLSNRQIASELIVSHSTIKFHVSSILGKLSAASRTEAVALALQHGLIESTE